MACFRRRVLIALLTLAYVRNKRKQLTLKSRNKRTTWMKEIFKRKERGEYKNLYQELRSFDRENFFRYIRMSKDRFDHLLSMVMPLLQKQSTRLREPISPEERLVITLRYLDYLHKRLLSVTTIYSHIYRICLLYLVMGRHFDHTLT